MNIAHIFAVRRLLCRTDIGCTGTQSVQFPQLLPDVRPIVKTVEELLVAGVRDDLFLLVLLLFFRHNRLGDGGFLRAHRLGGHGSGNDRLTGAFPEIE